MYLSRIDSPYHCRVLAYSSTVTSWFVTVTESLDIRTVTPGGGISFMLVSTTTCFIVTVPLWVLLLEGGTSSGLISILSSGATPAVALPLSRYRSLRIPLFLMHQQSPQNCNY